MPPPNDQYDFSVHLGGRHIAMLHRRDDYTWLTFEESYIEDPRRAVLGLRFEEDLRARYAANLRLPPWFSNLLPEGRLREWIAGARGAPMSREMELLAHVGHDLPGAVQVFPHGRAGQVSQGEATREVLADAPRPIASPGWRFSLAGVGLKLSMLRRGERFTAPGTGEGGDWIIKLPDAVHPVVPLNELTMMTLAREAGIDVPETRLVDRDELMSVPEDVWPRHERTAYAVRRFDRGPDRRAVHIEDLAQVRGVYPEDKYMGSFETVAALVYRGRDLESLLEVARRLAYNLLISNGDAHLKNWSLIYRNERIPTLSPAYDLVATAVYRPRGEPENMGLKFCGSRRFERIGIHCFVELGNRLGVGTALADEASSLVDRVLAAWPSVSDLLHDHPEMRSRIDESIRRAASLFRRSPKSRPQ